LAPGVNITLTFEWTTNRTGRYEILANTTEIPYDIDPADNTLAIMLRVAYGSNESINGSHILAILSSLFAAVMIAPEFGKNKKMSLFDLPASILKQNLHNPPNNTIDKWQDWIRRQPI
jgi:hypothetical protein